MRLDLRPGLTIATLVALAILVCLGVWQLQRLEWKQGLIAAVETRTQAEPIAWDGALSRQRAGEDMVYTPVSVTGRFVPGQERHVFGTWEATPGWYVFSPLETTDGQTVWVNRGFVPDALKVPQDRPGSRPSGPVTVTGLFRTPEEPAGIAKMVSAPNSPERNQWYVRDPRLFGEEADGGYYIDSFAGPDPEAWPRGGTTRLSFNNRHLEYALTWFGLAGALIAVFVAASLRRGE